MLPDDARAILEFWFGSAELDAPVPAEKSKLWWSSGAAGDAHIRQRFGALWTKAAAGALGHWTQTFPGRLALIILTDQLSRNIHRGTPRAFSADPLARRLSLAAIAARQDEGLEMNRRTFLYMPLEHAEDLALQERCVRLFEAMLADVEDDQHDAAAFYLTFARSHRDIIARFSRFPHRNPILGREHTAEEAAWLAAGGPTFGQSAGS